MVDAENSSKYKLGQVLVEVGKDKDFLYQNKHSRFSLQEKSDLIKGVVSKNLEYGGLNTVIGMVYGGFGGADLLYDLDKNKLNNEIVKSAVSHGKSIDAFDRSSVRNIKDNSDGSLLFKLGVIASTYEQFEDNVDLGLEFFQDKEKGEIRKRAYEKVLAGKALKESKIGRAVSHFVGINATDRIDSIFEEYLNGGDGYVLKQMALNGSPDKRDSRLKTLVVENKLDATNAFRTCKDYKINLTDKQREKLFDRLSSKEDLFNKWTIEDRLGLHYIPEISNFKNNVKLKWAKKHIKERPGEAYFIFLSESEKENGENLDNEIIQSVIAGLELNKSKNEKGLGVDRVKKEHLEQVYSQMDFGTQVDIARHLEDNEKKKELSRVANEGGDFNRAYNLWFEAEGVQEGEYIGSLRKKVVNEAIKDRLFWGIDNRDFIGRRLLFDNTINKKGFGEKDYRLAWEMKDESMLKLAREKLLNERGMRYAFNEFLKPNYNKEERDEGGIKLVKDTLSKKYGLEDEDLETILS